jgi:hypothetical protein
VKAPVALKMSGSRQQNMQQTKQPELDIFTDYLGAVHAKTSSQNTKILLFIDQCVVHPQGTSYLTNEKVAFAFLQLHHHSLTTRPRNNQFIQTLLQQAAFKRNYCCN